MIAPLVAKSRAPGWGAARAKCSLTIEVRDALTDGSGAHDRGAPAGHRALLANREGGAADGGGGDGGECAHLSERGMIGIGRGRAWRRVRAREWRLPSSGD